MAQVTQADVSEEAYCQAGSRQSPALSPPLKVTAAGTWSRRVAADRATVTQTRHSDLARCLLRLAAQRRTGPGPDSVRLGREQAHDSVTGTHEANTSTTRRRGKGLT